MILHSYRDALMWQRGEGLCAIAQLRAHGAQIHAVQLRIATPIFNPDMQGGSPVLDDSTRLTLTQAPSLEPLDLGEAKSFLRIEHTADDAAITRAIVAARQAAEQYLGMALLPQNYSYAVGAPRTVISLPVGPAQSITAITAMPETGDSYAVASTDYRLTLDGFGVIFHQLPHARAISIAFAAGYAATADAVPALLKQGMLHHVAAMLEQRSGVVPMPLQSLQCYQPYRRVRL